MRVFLLTISNLARISSFIANKKKFLAIEHIILLLAAPLAKETWNKFVSIPILFSMALTVLQQQNRQVFSNG